MSINYLDQFQQQSHIRIGYARVSSLDDRQELGLSVQLEALKQCDIVFSEKDSGANNERTQLHLAIGLAKDFTHVDKQVSLVIYKLDRLTRKMFTLATIIEELTHENIQLISLQENLETNSLTGKLLCLILGYVAEMELENIRLRTKEGLRKAREKGVRLGNRGISKGKENQIIRLYQEDQLSVRQIARKATVSPSTIYSVLKRRKILLKQAKKPCQNPQKSVN